MDRPQYPPYIATYITIYSWALMIVLVGREFHSLTAGILKERLLCIAIKIAWLWYMHIWDGSKINVVWIDDY